MRLCVRLQSEVFQELKNLKQYLLQKFDGCRGQHQTVWNSYKLGMGFHELRLVVIELSEINKYKNVPCGMADRNLYNQEEKKQTGTSWKLVFL